LHGTVVVVKPVSNYLVEKNRGKRKNIPGARDAARLEPQPLPLLPFRSVEVVVAAVVVDVEISAKNE
jgi:hypothetical protein